MRIFFRLGLICASFMWMTGGGSTQPSRSDDTSGAEPARALVNWQVPARLHHGLRSARGTLIIDADGVEFRSAPRVSRRWPFVEINTLDLMPRRLVITGYENRGWHQPGDRRYRFDLGVAMPPPVARELARRVSKPVRNGIPDPSAPSFFTIPARHRTRAGGSNGVLRFRNDGIDYVTSRGRDSRSWRWADIQALANPDSYQFRVGAYLETFDFELKQPVSPNIFDRLWDHVYARDLNVGQERGGEQHAEQ